MKTIPIPEGPGIIEFATEFLGKGYYSPHQRAILKAIYAEPLTSNELDAYREMDDCHDAPRPEGYTKVAAICGTRGGKSDFASTIAAFECARWGDVLRDMLMPGQKATGIIIAENKKQGGIVRGYIEGALKTLEGKGFSMLKVTEGQTRSVTEQVIKLEAPIEIVIYPCNKASVRGCTGFFFIGDEIAWWQSAEGAYNQDSEVMKAVRSRFATLSRLRPKQIMISSPNEESGVLYEAYVKRENSRTLVVKAPTQMLNPSIDLEFLADELEEDSVAYARDYDAEFQPPGGGSNFLAKEIVDQCVRDKPIQILPKAGTFYKAAIDAAFKVDRFALAISHLEADGEHAPIDHIRFWTPQPKIPLDPDVVVVEICDELKSYGIDKVFADQFADVPLQKLFAKNGIKLVLREHTAGAAIEMFKNLRGALRGALTSIPDIKEVKTELKGLVTSKTRATKVTHIGAPNLKGRYDDNAKAIALVLQETLPKKKTVDIHDYNKQAAPETDAWTRRPWTDPEPSSDEDRDSFSNLMERTL